MGHRKQKEWNSENTPGDDRHVVNCHARLNGSDNHLNDRIPSHRINWNIDGFRKASHQCHNDNHYDHDLREPGLFHIDRDSAC